MTLCELQFKLHQKQKRIPVQGLEPWDPAWKASMLTTYIILDDSGILAIFDNYIFTKTFFHYTSAWNCRPMYYSPCTVCVLSEARWFLEAVLAYGTYYQGCRNFVEISGKDIEYVVCWNFKLVCWICSDELCFFTKYLSMFKTECRRSNLQDYRANSILD